MKRRLSANKDGDDDSPSPFPTGRRKRVRHGSLERRLAHMTLGTPEEVDMWPKTSPLHPRVQDILNVILPSSVEEPDTPASEPVDMEVEPSLITTDTPSSHAIDDWESARLDINGVQISSAVLECLRRQSKCPPPLLPLPCQTSQALVLYRAPRPPSPKPLGPACEHQDDKSSWRSTPAVREDDVMEVE